MENPIKPPQNPTPDDVLDEAECAARLKVRRETLYRWRHDLGMPFVPLSDKRAAQVRYIWPDVIAWLRSRSKGHGAPPAARKRGRPRNVDRTS